MNDEDEPRPLDDVLSAFPPLGEESCSDITRFDPPSEDSVAIAFCREYEGKLVFNHDAGSWLEWLGFRWQLDRTARAFHYTREVSRAASRRENTSVRMSMGRRAFAAGVEQFARTDPKFARTAMDFDGNPNLLGTPAGTVDLMTGDLRSADPTEGISRATAVGPSVDEDCPGWKRFLGEATGGDVELIRFLQQWSGYCLTGHTREHGLVFMWGPGGNGKSVFLNTVSSILGDYAVASAMETFEAARSSRHSTDLAMLNGARLVTASETEEGREWAEARIKHMTGGDPITARFMRQDNFTFVPQFKLTLVGNHKPAIRSLDDAIRRRFMIVPFTRAPSAPDRELFDKLHHEYPGILRWMINGSLDWTQNGLIRPSQVAKETEAYFAEQDVFGHWLNESCDVAMGNDARSATVEHLYRSWCQFAQAAGEKPGSAKAFHARMRQRGFEPHRNAVARSFRFISLRV